MENQPPTNARPWFRLASLARMEQAQAQAQAQASSQAPAPAPAPVLVPVPAPAPAPPVRPITPAPIPRIPLARALTMLTQAPQYPQLPPQQQQETAPRSSANGAATDSQQPPQPRSSVNGAASDSQPPPPNQQNSVNGAASDPQPPPNQQNSVNGAASDTQQPPKPQNPTPPPSPRVSIPTSHAPPGSPRVINPNSTPTPPDSPKKTRGQLQPSLTPLPHPEPEPKPLMEPLPKSIFMEREDGTNGNVKAVADAESRVDGGQTMPPLPRNKTATNGRLATRKKDDGETKVITMAGENMGAYMELGSPHLHQKNLSGKHPSGHEGKDRELVREDGKVADKKKEGKPMAVVVNSNVQSVNNSILLGSSCTLHSPGVHIDIATHRKPKLPKGSTTDSSFRKGNPHFRNFR